MLILTLRTDKPEAEIGLFDNDQQLAYQTWQAHRLLAETIHATLRDLLATQNIELADIKGVVVFKGPGSFTGLRIGVSVANALSGSLKIPIVGETGDDWLKTGRPKLQKGQNDRLVMPEYGALPKTTKPKG